MTKSRNLIDQIVSRKLTAYQQIALEIHSKPEVSNYEFFASKALAEQLIEDGFEVKLDVAGHYARPDAFELTVKKRSTPIIREEDC